MIRARRMGIFPVNVSTTISSSVIPLIHLSLSPSLQLLPHTLPPAPPPGQHPPFCTSHPDPPVFRYQIQIQLVPIRFMYYIDVYLFFYKIKR
jgi:hypothetical protein